MANRNTYTININASKTRLTVRVAKPGTTELFFQDTVEVHVGTGWDPDDDPYVWRIHSYAPNARNTGPDYSKSEGAWQSDCLVPPVERLGVFEVEAGPSNGDRPKTVTVTNREVISLPGSQVSHWLTGRIAWGPKPADPCATGKSRRNLTFDPELINRSGTPPNAVRRIHRFLNLLRRLLQRLTG